MKYCYRISWSVSYFRLATNIHVNTMHVAGMSKNLTQILCCVAQKRGSTTSYITERKEREKIIPRGTFCFKWFQT